MIVPVICCRGQRGHSIRREQLFVVSVSWRHAVQSRETSVVTKIALVVVLAIRIVTRLAVMYDTA